MVPRLRSSQKTNLAQKRGTPTNRGMPPFPNRQSAALSFGRTPVGLYLRFRLQTYKKCCGILFTAGPKRVKEGLRQPVCHPIVATGARQCVERGGSVPLLHVSAAPAVQRKHRAGGANGYKVKLAPPPSDIRARRLVWCFRSRG